MTYKALKFSATCFGLQLLFMVIAYMVSDEKYQGDDGMVIVANVMGIIAAGVCFVAVFYIASGLKIALTKPFLTYFLVMLITINLLTLAFSGMTVTYPISFVALIFKVERNRGMVIFQLLNPIAGFLLAMLMEKTKARREAGIS